MKIVLEKKLYYIPIYCYRHFPSDKDIYEKIIKDLINYGKIQIYESEEKAYKKAKSFMCDDDCCTTAILDFTQGWCNAYYIGAEEQQKIGLYHLDCWTNCYKIIK